MVEGPSCRRKADKLQVLCGQVLLTCSLAALQSCTSQPVLRVFAIGKELFIVFRTAALRLHFGMSGGVEYRSCHAPRQKQWREEDLVAEFTNRMQLFLHGATAKAVSHDYLKAAESRKHLDILSPIFDYTAAVTLLSAAGSKLICDVLMDQLVLPGVGNVIKVEGLFAARVNPLLPSSSLSAAQHHAVLKGLRNCAQQWYDALRGRGQLAKACYGRKQCTKCQRKILVVREGSMGRLTYFCNHCQPAAEPKPVEARAQNSQTDSTALPIPLPIAESKPQQASVQIRAPLCACNQRCMMKQTFKEGANKGRYYFSCFRRNCKTFQWLECQLPSCPHGPGRLRRVLKLGSNNGRMFVACSAPPGTGCNMFHWAAIEEVALPEPAQLGSGHGYTSTTSLASSRSSLATIRRVATPCHSSLALARSVQKLREGVHKRPASSQQQRASLATGKSSKRARLVVNADGDLVCSSETRPIARTATAESGSPPRHPVETCIEIF